MFERLVEQGLVKEKKYPNGLSVFKYSRKVFYDALWETDPLLLEARGMVLDAEGNKVIWPFTKVFNYGENGTGLDLDPECEVQVVDKKNGFMAAATWYKGELIVSTTGTLDSEFAQLAREYIEKLDTKVMLLDHTYIFEICSPQDPHIVDEAEGAWLIGVRVNKTGRMWKEDHLDSEADLLKGEEACLRPGRANYPWKEVARLVKDSRIEGFMIRDPETGETLMKIKSPHYLIKKFLMRIGKAKVDMIANNPQGLKQTIDEEYYPLIDYISASYRQSWKDMSEQERRIVIEDYFNETR